MNISLMTPQQVVWTGEAQEVVLNAHKGQLDILDRHADLITELHAGPVILKTGGQKKAFNVGTGVVRIQDGKCSILCLEATEVKA